jgi:hypothetical protein
MVRVVANPQREAEQMSPRAVDERLVGRAQEPRNERLYRRMRFIRRFEETLLRP